MTKKIPKSVVSGLGRIMSETVTEILKEPGRMTGLAKKEGSEGAAVDHHPKKDGEGNFDSVLGKVTSINSELLEKYKDRDSKKSEKEAEEIRGQLSGPVRNVEREMGRVRAEKDKEKAEEERFLAQIKRQRENEGAEEQDELVVPVGKKARGTAFLKGKKQAAGTGELVRKKN